MNSNTYTYNGGNSQFENPNIMYSTFFLPNTGIKLMEIFSVPYDLSLGNAILNIYVADSSYQNIINIFQQNIQIVSSPPTPCFLYDSKILTNKGYRPIQDLRKGDLVKTLKHYYKPINMIGKSNITHNASEERIKNQLYKCTKEQYPELNEDLIITGCHSILVDSFKTEEQIKKAIQVNEDRLCVTDDKFRLPACLDDRATVYEKSGEYTIYHLALENENYFSNYGIYANGLLVESVSNRYLKELSGMELIE